MSCSTGSLVKQLTIAVENDDTDSFDAIVHQLKLTNALNLDDNSALVAAIRDTNSHYISQILKFGIVNIHANANEPLYEAACRGNLGVVTALLLHGADSTANNYRAFIAAVTYAQNKILRLFIRHSKIDLANNQELSLAAFLEAIRSGHTNSSLFLYKHGAYTSIKSDFLKTLIKENNKNLVKFLKKIHTMYEKVLKKYENANQVIVLPAIFHDTPVVCAFEGNLDMFKHVTNIAQSYDIHKANIINKACAGGHTHMIQYLIDEAANCSMDVSKLFTNDDVKCVVQSGNRQAVDLLLSYNVDMSFDDGVIMVSVAFIGDIELFDLLHTKYNVTPYNNIVGPLAQAIKINHYTMVEHLLLNYNYDITYNKHTLIQTAAQYADPAMMKLLIKHGADINADNYNCLAYAITDGKHENFQFLLDNNIEITKNTFPYAIAKNQYDMATQLFNKLTFDMNNQQDYKYIRKAFYAVAANGNIQIMELITSKTGLNPGFKNGKAVERAVLGQQYEATEWFLSRIPAPSHPKVTLLYDTIINNDLRMFKLLRKYNIVDRVNDEATQLEFCIHQDVTFELAIEVMNTFPDQNVNANNGRILAYAVNQQKQRYVDFFLIKYNPNTHTLYKATAQALKRKSQYDTFKQLCKHPNADINYKSGKLFLQAVRFNNIPAMNYLHNHNINATIHYDKCYEQAACKANNKAIAWLLEHNIPCDTQSLVTASCIATGQSLAQQFLEFIMTHQ